MKNEPIEWCELMSGSSKSNRLLMALLESVKQKAPQFFHECPYYGRHEIAALGLTKPLLDIIPVGSYKIMATMNITKPEKCEVSVVVQFSIT